MLDVFKVKRSADSDDVLKCLNGQFMNVITTTADTELEDVQSGSIVFVNGATTHDVTLPSAAAGLWFKFIITDVTADVDIVQAASDEDFVGTIVTGAGGSDSAVSGDTKIIFDQSGGVVVGDSVTVVSNGTNWYVSGTCDAAGGVVFG